MSLNKNFYAPEDYEASVPRAYHDLSTKRSFTPQTGQLIPVYNRRMYPGDDFKISVGSLLQTINPLTYPLLDCFELRLEYYFCPLSNYYGWMDNNSRNATNSILNNRFKWTACLFGWQEDPTDGKWYRLGMFSKGFPFGKYRNMAFETESKNVYFSTALSQSGLTHNAVYFTPHITPDEYFGYRQAFIDNVDNAYEHTIFRGSLLESLGLPAGMQTGGSTAFVSPAHSNWQTGGFLYNLEPFLCYLDIWRTYHANLQYDLVPVAGRGLDGGRSGFDSYYDDTIWSSVSKLDRLFLELRNKTGLLDYSSNDVTLFYDRSYYDGGFGDSSLNRLYKHIVYASNPNGGYMPVQYRPDMWRNLLSSNVGSVKSKVRVNDGTITIDEFRRANKIQRLIDAIDLSGGRYSNLLKTIFGWKSRKQLDIPQLLAVTTHLIDPSNITAMAQSDGVDLGQMGAKIDKYETGRTVRVKADVDGYVMICASIIPRISYSQGVLPNVVRSNFSDDFDPNLQRLGFQDVPRKYFSVYEDVIDSTSETLDIVPQSIDTVVGKQIAWIDEITDVNRTFGEFSSWGGVYSPMVLNRSYSKFSYSDSFESVFVNSPYVSLSDNRDIFAEYSSVVSPWSLHLAFNINAKRPIGKRYRPNLE